jgi:hypothetical protein
MVFWIAWIIDALIGAVFAFFFVAGIDDHTVSAVNIGLWLGILGALAIVLGGGLALRSHGRRPAATALALVLAVPGIAFVLFFLIVILSGARMN